MTANVQLTHDSLVEVGMLCNLSIVASNNGSIRSVPVFENVRAGRRTTFTTIGTVDIVFGTGTITGTCGAPGGCDRNVPLLRDSGGDAALILKVGSASS